MAFKNPLTRLLRTTRPDGLPGVDVGQAPFDHFNAPETGPNPDGSSVLTLYDSGSDSNAQPGSTYVGNFAALATFASTLIFGMRDTRPGRSLGWVSSILQLYMPEVSGQATTLTLGPAAETPLGVHSESRISSVGYGGTASISSENNGTVRAETYASDYSGGPVTIGEGQFGYAGAALNLRADLIKSTVGIGVDGPSSGWQDGTFDAAKLDVNDNGSGLGGVNYRITHDGIVHVRFGFKTHAGYTFPAGRTLIGGGLPGSARPTYMSAGVSMDSAGPIPFQSFGIMTSGGNLYFVFSQAHSQAALYGYFSYSTI